MKCDVVFFDEQVRDKFYSLMHSTSEDRMVYQALRRTIDKIKNDYESGTFIPNNLVPKFYRKKYDATTIWKYNLPNGWRLIYKVDNDEKNRPVAVILKWMSHNQYDEDFGYK